MKSNFSHAVTRPRPIGSRIHSLKQNHHSVRLPPNDLFISECLSNCKSGFRKDLPRIQNRSISDPTREKSGGFLGIKSLSIH